MKKIISIAAALSCLCGIIPAESLSSVSAESAALADAGIDYTESTGYDLGYFDCGYSGTDWIRAAPGKIWNSDPKGLCLLLIGIGPYSSGINGTDTDYDLDEAFFTSLENALINARKNGATVGIRLRYDDNGAANPEPATFEKVLDHVHQLGESGLLEKYEDVITYVESGLVGSWGEQWGGKFTSLECKAELLENFLDIVPDSISVSVRTPNTVRTWLKMYCGIDTSAADMLPEISDPEYARKFARIGMYNDGYMGSDSDLGTYSDRKGETDWLASAAMYGGEYSGSDEWRLKYKDWQPQNCLPEMYKTHVSHINCNAYREKSASGTYTTRDEAQAQLDKIDALYEACGMGSYDYKGSITEKDGSFVASWLWAGYDSFIFNEELDEACGVSCDNSAFYGQTVWQFIRSHLGYRYVLRSSELSQELDPGDTLELRFDVENTGFAASPKSKETEVILSDGCTCYTFMTDIDAKDWLSAQTSHESLSIPLPETITGGNWNVYLRVSNPNEDVWYDNMYCVKFANNNLQYDETLGANLLGTVKVSGTVCEKPVIPENKRPDGYFSLSPQAVPVDESTQFRMLDTPFAFADDHYGITALYKVEGITEGSEIQLGNWYLNFSSGGGGYGSAYTTYGLNILNLKLSENGTYLLNIPFYSAVFNFPGIAAGGNTTINTLTFNDSLNYWSEDTKTLLGGNSNVKITPIGVAEGSPSGYSVTFHLPDGDAVYTGDYGLTDVSKQSITSKKAVTALSLLDKPCDEKCTDSRGRTCILKGFTTKQGDADYIIDADFPAIGDIELYPYYETDMASTDFNLGTEKLTGFTDSQGISYLLDTENRTASVGDGSAWKNNSGYSGADGGNIVIPAMVEADGVTYSVVSVAENAFASNTSVKSVVLPDSISGIGKNAFCEDTVTVYAYSGSAAEDILRNTEYDTVFMDSRRIFGDVNSDGKCSSADIVMLQRWLTGRTDALTDPAAADVYADASVDIFDVILLKKHLIAFNIK